MQQHPVIGERILRGVPYLEDVARAVRHEHERWDGQGYPDGLEGEAIPLASRVVFACDAWHAMTSDRPYRKALSADEARAELVANAGTQFDPQAVRAVLEVVGSGAAELPEVDAPADLDTEEQLRSALLAEVAETTGADDLFVFRLTSPGRYTHFGGAGRGEGWAGNVELDAAHEHLFAQAVDTGEPVGIAHEDRGRVVGPYYARTAVIVPSCSNVVVVLGSAGDALAGPVSRELVDAVRPAAEAIKDIPPAKKLADELEVLDAVRAIMAIPASSVEATLSQVAQIAAQSLSCEYGGVLVFDAAGELRVGEAELGWSPPLGETVELIAPEALPRLDFPLVVQEVSTHPYLGTLAGLRGATAVHAVELGDPRLGVLFVVHADSAPRGFTVLCRRLARSVADAAEVVIRRALAQEQLGESRG
jgi:hypothetical protein